MATGNDQINIDRSDDEIVKSYHNFDLNFDVLSIINTSNTQMTSGKEILELEEEMTCPAQDEALPYCLSQTEEKENIGKESKLRFPELNEKEFVELEDTKDSM